MTMSERALANVAVTARWGTTCKDCLSRAAANPRHRNRGGLEQPAFEYSDEWALRTLERGGSRSDRCPECRKTHAQQIRAFPVAYVDIKAIGEAAIEDPASGPTGPLGGLGPLPGLHRRDEETVQLAKFEMGLNDDWMLQLLDKLVSHQVVILEAGTGTGKSTLAPFRLMNPPAGTPYRPIDFGPIIVTEPRVPATTEVAAFVGEALCFNHDPKKCRKHIGPGFPVGYQCEGKKVWDEACRLIYVTDGTLINWIRNGDLARYSTVVIDEAHERSENIDLILTLLHEFFPRYKNLKVIIASATIDKHLFTTFFKDVASVGELTVEANKQVGYGAPLFAGQGFPADLDSFLENGLTLAGPADRNIESTVFHGWRKGPYSSDDPWDLREVTRTLLGLRVPIKPSITPKQIAEACAEQAFSIIKEVVAGNIPPGDVLVFLPTEELVRSAQTKLRTTIDPLRLPVRSLWLMKATPKDEKEEALAECPPGSFKVVFASNLAETSLTIAGLRYVVDSGLVCQAEWDPTLATGTAPTKVHSQSGVRQRWGRVGRKTYGWAFPMYGLAQFLEMARDTPAGSTQTNLEQFFVRLAAAGVDDARSVKCPATLPGGNAEAAANFTAESQRALKALEVNGALAKDGYLTSLGRELERSRLSSERTMALLLADRLACVPEVAVALVALDVGGLVGSDRLLLANSEWPGAWNVLARRCHEALAWGCTDDLDLVLRVYAEWEQSPDRSAWCRQWWINEEALIAIRQEVATLIEDLAPGMSKAAGRPIAVTLADRARAALSRALPSLQYRRQPDGSWVSANGMPTFSDRRAPVLAARRLVTPSNWVVALARERPRTRVPGTPVDAPPVLLGLINVLPWACPPTGGREDVNAFDLLVQASLELHGSDVAMTASADRLRATRASFPVGAILECQLDRHLGEREARVIAARLARKPFALPAIIPRRPGAETRGSGRKPRTASQFYRGEGRRGTEASGDFRTRIPEVAGTEAPQEEVQEQPLSPFDLEPDDLGAVRQHPKPYAPPSSIAKDNRLTTETRAVSADRAIFAQQDSSLLAEVEGYQLTDGVPVLVLNPVGEATLRRSDPAVHEGCDPRQPVLVIAGRLVQDHFGAYRLLHRCDEQGVPNGLGDFFFHGPGIDDWDYEPAGGVRPGSRWKARVLAWDRANEEQSISLIEEMYEQLTLGLHFGERGHSRTVPGKVAGRLVLVGEIEMLPVDIDVPGSVHFSPRIFVPWSHGVAHPEVGSSVQLVVGPKRQSRRSGRWAPEQLNEIKGALKEIDIAVEGNRNGTFTVSVPGSFSLGLLDRISKAVDPTGQRRHDMWRLWATSRHYGAAREPRLQVIPSAVAEAPPSAPPRLVKQPTTVRPDVWPADTHPTPVRPQPLRPEPASSPLPSRVTHDRRSPRRFLAKWAVMLALLSGAMIGGAAWFRAAHTYPLRWEVSDNGTVAGLGSAGTFGSGPSNNNPVVGMATTAKAKGYWLVASDGSVSAFGNARFEGDTSNRALTKPIVGIASTPDGAGYWLVGSDGGVFSFGDAKWYGSRGNVVRGEPIVGIVATSDGNGYWLVGAEGGVFAYGDAQFFGSPSNLRLRAPVTAMARTTDGAGYWLVGADGGVFNYGDARIFGSPPSDLANAKIVAIAGTPQGNGYWLVASNGEVFAYGAAQHVSGPANGLDEVVGIGAIDDR